MDTQILRRFVDAINNHDVGKLTSLMADDHTFIDAYGTEIVGCEKMKAGWKGYFQWFPNYKIEITDVAEGDHFMAAFGCRRHGKQLW